MLVIMMLAAAALSLVAEILFLDRRPCPKPYRILNAR